MIDMTYSLVIIDDHPTVREGIKAIIKESREIKVVGEAGNAEEGFSKVKKYKPDTVLLDISLPDENGIALAKKIKKALPNTKIIILSIHSKIEYIKESFRAGVSGYILKESPPERLIEGIKKVNAGYYFIDSCASHEVVRELIETHKSEPSRLISTYSTLSKREQQILKLIAEGMHNRDIAKTLFISVKTVENHRTNILKKLNLKSTADLVKYAIKIGIIDINL